MQSDDDSGATPTTRATTTSVGVLTTFSTVTVERTCSAELLRGTSAPSPSQGAPLADGRHFGFVTFLDAEDLSVQFDVAQLFTGEAIKAAGDDGGGSPPPNDYWIRNNTKATRTLKPAADAALCIPVDPNQPAQSQPVSLERLNRHLGDGEPVAVWVDVRSGTAVRLEQLFR